MDRFSDAREILPEFGRMLHLPFEPNCDRDDLVATLEEAEVIFSKTATCVIEEKIDGSQVGLSSAGDGNPPIVRNKNHILVKGYGRKNTNAKTQYAPLWNWVYEHADCFRELTALLGEPVGVYGEWIYAEHTLRYDLAPDDFIAYQIHQQGFGIIDPVFARNAIQDAGFHVPPLLLPTAHFDYTFLKSLTLQPSPWSSRDLREGVVVKVGDGERLVAQFKMRRGSFKPREDFNYTPLRRRARTK